MITFSAAIEAFIAALGEPSHRNVDNATWHLDNSSVTVAAGDRMIGVTMTVWQQTDQPKHLQHFRDQKTLFPTDVPSLAAAIEAAENCLVMEP